MKEIDDAVKKNKIDDENENENENENSLSKDEKAPEGGNKYVYNLLSLSSNMMKRAQESTAVQVNFLQVRSKNFHSYLSN